MRVNQLGLRPATLRCLHTAGITSIEQLTSYACTDLMDHPAIGMAELHEIICQLTEHDLMLPNAWGRLRQPSPRVLEMFRLRFIEGLTLKETGKRTGVSRSRVHQLLHTQYGASRWPPNARERQRLHEARERTRAQDGARRLAVSPRKSR